MACVPRPGGSRDPGAVRALGLRPIPGQWLLRCFGCQYQHAAQRAGVYGGATQGAGLSQLGGCPGGVRPGEPRAFVSSGRPLAASPGAVRALGPIRGGGYGKESIQYFALCALRTGGGAE